MEFSLTSFTMWFTRAISLGTVIMLGALGEILTEKSGHLNLGVPGMVFMGGCAGFAASYLYETSASPIPVFMILIPIIISFAAGAFGGLIYSFLTVTLRANQNVTGLALTMFGVGVGRFGGTYVLGLSGSTSYAKAGETYDLFAENLNSLLGLKHAGKFVSTIGEIFLSYGFFIYAVIIIAILMYLFFKKTRAGLNLRAIGESPATADAAGINVSRYKYLSTVIGGGLCGLGGLAYVMFLGSGGWSTANNIEALGWLAVALVIFATWKPLNAIWGSYLFAGLYLFATYCFKMLGIRITQNASSVTDILQMLPYVVTVIILILISIRKKRENQPPASLGLPYFREER